MRPRFIIVVGNLQLLGARVGEAIRAPKIPISKVLSSEYRRAAATARLVIDYFQGRSNSGLGISEEAPDILMFF